MRASEGESRSAGKFALFSGVAAVLAFIACNGLIVLTALLAVFGITFNINPHLQAILICIFAILTSVLVFKGYQQHRKAGPMVVASVGAIVIILTMYVSYSKAIESTGLLALVIAAVWNWRATAQKASRA